ncbi:uncharacterized protein LOC143898678 [Temnothorax americanus]|uniref:uncharacterized protein LOC143898678 n=1 Tax=Temnothorax americanus TaxID=1964332 RepID=UPI004067D8FD
MSHLRFMKELDNLTRMPAWTTRSKARSRNDKRNALEASNLSVNISLNSSKKVTGCSFTSSTSGKTPTKRSDCETKKTPFKCTKKSPNKMPHVYTLLKKTKFQLPLAGDRFIPSRATTNFELSHFKNVP